MMLASWWMTIPEVGKTNSCSQKDIIEKPRIAEKLS